MGVRCCEPDRRCSLCAAEAAKAEQERRRENARQANRRRVRDMVARDASMTYEHVRAENRSAGISDEMIARAVEKLRRPT